MKQDFNNTKPRFENWQAMGLQQQQGPGNGLTAEQRAANLAIRERQYAAQVAMMAKPPTP